MLATPLYLSLLCFITYFFREDHSFFRCIVSLVRLTTAGDPEILLIAGSFALIITFLLF